MSKAAHAKIARGTNLQLASKFLRGKRVPRHLISIVKLTAIFEKLGVFGEELADDAVERVKRETTRAIVNVTTYENDGEYANASLYTHLETLEEKADGTVIREEGYKRVDFLTQGENEIVFENVQRDTFRYNRRQYVNVKLLNKFAEKNGWPLHSLKYLPDEDDVE